MGSFIAAYILGSTFPELENKIETAIVPVSFMREKQLCHNKTRRYSYSGLGSETKSNLNTSAIN